MKKTKSKPDHTSAGKPGQPSKFQKSFVHVARVLAEKGCVDAEIAEAFSISLRTLHKWKAEHPEFGDALKNGKMIADNTVTNSLYSRATGYSHPDAHISNFQGAITVTPIVKHYPPDTTACIFWLKNRRPDLWRDKVESKVEHSGTINMGAILKEISAGGLPSREN